MCQSTFIYGWELFSSDESGGRNIIKSFVMEQVLESVPKQYHWHALDMPYRRQNSK